MRLDAPTEIGAVPGDGLDLPFPLVPGAARFFGNGAAYLVASDEIDAERLVMPVVIRRRGPFRLLRCLFAPVREDGAVPSVESETAFLERFLAFVHRDRTCHRIGQPENWALFRSAPAASISAPFGTYRIPLTGHAIDEVVAGFKPRYRSYVRKGATEGAVLRTGGDALDAFYPLHATTMERAGLWLAPRAQFDDLLAAFGPVADVGVIQVDGRAVAGELVMTTRFGTFGLYGGTSRDAPTYAGKFLRAEMMRRSIERGAAFYDFVGARLSDVGGTSVEGIQQFKSGFGADLVAGVLWKADIDRLRCTALDTLQRVRGGGGGGGGDIIDQERSRTSAASPEMP